MDMRSKSQKWIVVFVLIGFITSCGGGTKTQIDRSGRPLANLAANATFSSEADRNASLDLYNQTSNKDSVDQFKDVFAKSLAMYDALQDESNDLRACADNVITNRISFTNSTMGADTNPDRYQLFAALLADDQIYINTASIDCSQYMAVELTKLGFALSNDCGGRKPSMDVVETTYSILMSGELTGTDDDVAPTTSSSTFPFLQNPS